MQRRAVDDTGKPHPNAKNGLQLCEGHYGNANDRLRSSAETARLKAPCARSRSHLDEPSSAKAGEGFILTKPRTAARCRLNGLPHTVDAGLRGVALRLGGADRFVDHRTCQYVSVTLPIGSGGVRSLGGLRRAAHDSG